MLAYIDMQPPPFARTIIAALILFGWGATVPVAVFAQRALSAPAIPRTWEDVAVSTMEIPLAQPERSAVHVTSEYYYRIPERIIYKSYPVYAPSRQPSGYIQWLRQQEPEIAFDSARLKTTSDWTKAGETVFGAPFSYNAWTTVGDLQTQEWWKTVDPPVDSDGILPSVRYVVRTKGQIDVTSFSCAQCHTRVLTDGKVIAGAQGNYPISRAQAYNLRRSDRQTVMAGERSNYAAPWMGAMDPFARLNAMTLAELIAARELIPSGVNARPLTSPFSPAQIPDLIGVKDRRYLDHTGLMQQRDIGDLMRYAAANQDASALARHGDFLPAGVLPQPERYRGRYSDPQLYALALYVYSLEPPSNPNRPGALSRRGESVFAKEGCSGCHTPPLYTNNKLTPVAGFKVPEGHSRKYNIFPVVVGTDATLALGTRRGTGYYKVPSLKGVWYRGPFEHSGSVATLEDWFDPKRLSEDYVPTGFRGYGVKTRAINGHEFGLKLSADDKAALMAFLKTL
jgi:hypothetical protein